MAETITTNTSTLTITISDCSTDTYTVTTTGMVTFDVTDSTHPLNQNFTLTN